MKTKRLKKQLFASKKRLISVVLFSSVLILSILLLPPNSSAWWSTFVTESVHEKISNKAFDLVLTRLVNKSFLTTYRDSIVAYTTSTTNDTSAHGGDSERNGGNIADWFNAFRTAYNENRLDDAAEYLGYCLHLIEDMNVPAHAVNIPHYQFSDPIDFDNFEFMANEFLNILFVSLPDIVIVETDQPSDPTSYYSRARDDTKARITSGFSEYWHSGDGPDWNGDGPQGYYHDQIDDEDIFPKLYSSMSQQETDFLIGQLSEAVRYVGMFLLAVDRTPSTLYANFTGNGIWQYNGSTWNQLTPNSPETMAASDSTLYGDFGSSGIWMYNGTAWSQATPSNPQMMTVSGSFLYGAFSGAGIWRYNGTSWSQATPSNPEAISASGSNLYGDFGSSGIWMYNGTTWTQLASSNPESMAASGSLLYGDFESSGIWQYNGTTWTQLTWGNPEAMAASGSLLYGDFGSSGIWMYNGTTWSQLASSNPESMAASGSLMYGDFGTNGVYMYNGTTWSQLTPGNPTNMAVSQ